MNVLVNIISEPSHAPILTCVPQYCIEVSSLRAIHLLVSGRKLYGAPASVLTGALDIWSSPGPQIVTTTSGTKLNCYKASMPGCRRLVSDLRSMRGHWDVFLLSSELIVICSLGFPHQYHISSAEYCHIFRYCSNVPAVTGLCVHCQVTW